MINAFEYIYCGLLGKIVDASIIKSDSNALWDSASFKINGDYKEAFAVGFNSESSITRSCIVCAVLMTDNGECIVLSPSETEIYEPQIRHEAQIQGINIISCICHFEKTCGAMLYTYTDESVKYLLIENESGHIGFAKGHIEFGESEVETAKREVFEETGITINPNPDKRYEYTYHLSEHNNHSKFNIRKRCIYFTSKFQNQQINIQQEEINRYWLADKNAALKLLNYQEDIEIFTDFTDSLEG